MPDDLDGCPTRVVGRTPAMFHNTLVVGSSIRKPGKSSKTVKTPGDLDRCPTKGAGRTPTMFHNTLVVGSSPTSSTTQSPPTREISAGKAKSKLYANIRSVLETARRRTIGALQASPTGWAADAAAMGQQAEEFRDPLWVVSCSKECGAC